MFITVYVENQPFISFPLLFDIITPLSLLSMENDELGRASYSSSFSLKL